MALACQFISNYVQTQCRRRFPTLHRLFSRLFLRPLRTQQPVFAVETVETGRAGNEGESCACGSRIGVFTIDTVRPGGLIA